MMSALQDVLNLADEQGDDVMNVVHAHPGDPDQPGAAIVIAIHDLQGRSLVLRCQIAGDGDGVSAIATAYHDGEPIDLVPMTFLGQVSLAL